ncbi:MAG: TIGR04255 family protein [Desulfococcaceae bacterium]
MNNERPSPKIPIRLKKEPLLEAIFEIRFTGAKQSVAELLPGLIFKAMPEKYPETVRLPAADIPARILENDPNLKFVPKIRLQNQNQAIQIGEHVVSISCRRPYSGWAVFSKDIRNLIFAIRETKLIRAPERFSLKYIDLIALNPPRGLKCLNIDLRIGEYALAQKPVQIRTEIEEADLTHILQIVSPAIASLPGEEKQTKGILIDIDSIWNPDEKNPWEGIESRLDDIHSSCKQMFFSLLTQRTIDLLAPEYGE